MAVVCNQNGVIVEGEEEIVGLTTEQVTSYAKMLDGARGPMTYTGQGRYASDLFGTPTRPECAKIRWVRWL